MATDLAFATGSAVTVSTAEVSLISGTITLSSSTTAGAFQLVLDSANLTATEQYELRVYEAALVGGTKRLAQKIALNGAQAAPIIILPALLLGAAWDITLIKLIGTDRTFSWSIRRVF